MVNSSTPTPTGSSTQGVCVSSQVSIALRMALPFISSNVPTFTRTPDAIFAMPAASSGSHTIIGVAPAESSTFAVIS
ncbi:Uncharacterised protein [Chlamydia trachomatis]|nr:Uncharacterised protein [Chlamydia trachomatis]